MSTSSRWAGWFLLWVCHSAFLIIAQNFKHSAGRGKPGRRLFLRPTGRPGRPQGRLNSPSAPKDRLPRFLPQAAGQSKRLSAAPGLAMVRL